MKYIKKDKKNEPKTLKEYRETTPNAIYSGFGDKNQLLKKALLKEQGYICAYCMKRISLERNEGKPKIEVEHYKSQEKYPKEDLNYMNMLGVCNGNSGDKEHCDKKKKEVELKILNPLKKNINKNLITYSLSGKIKSKSNNSNVESDINLLNLNDDGLIKIRKGVLKNARDIFEKNNHKKKDKTWTLKMFDKEIEKYKTLKSGKYTPFCQFIIWHFEQLKTKSKYQ